jgi:uncharacterized surface anchored protein
MAPLGYQLDSTKKIEFTISKDNDGKIIQLGDSDHKIYNEREKGKVTIQKTDSYGNYIDGAKFNLYSDQPRNPIESIQNKLGREWFLYQSDITTQSGSVTISGLPWGDYYFVETEAPATVRGCVAVGADTDTD